MKSTGIVKEFDNLGRIGIPKKIRDRFEIVEKTKMDIYVEGQKIIMQKYERSCTFCDSNKELLVFDDKLICKKCLAKIENKLISVKTKIKE